MSQVSENESKSKFADMQNENSANLNGKNEKIQKEKENQTDTVQNKAAGEGAGKEKELLLKRKITEKRIWSAKVRSLKLHNVYGWRVCFFFLLTLLYSEKGLWTERFPLFLQIPAFSR